MKLKLTEEQKIARNLNAKEYRKRQKDKKVVENIEKKNDIQKEIQDLKYDVLLSEIRSLHVKLDSIMFGRTHVPITPFINDPHPITITCASETRSTVPTVQSAVQTVQSAVTAIQKTVEPEKPTEISIPDAIKIPNNGLEKFRFLGKTDEEIKHIIDTAPGYKVGKFIEEEGMFENPYPLKWDFDKKMHVFSKMNILVGAPRLTAFEVRTLINKGWACELHKGDMDSFYNTYSSSNHACHARREELAEDGTWYPQDKDKTENPEFYCDPR